MTASQAKDLCLACGLCCDGTIFDVARVDEAELPALTRLGIRTATRAFGPVLVQPCVALDGTRCTVYGDRPHTCRAFRCNLLIALEADEVELDECLAHVDQAKRLKHEHAIEPDDRKAARLRLEDYLDRHFRGRQG
ncbi:MAG: YkgJ family cysteine cluster protein [Myxococcota bacterium]